MLIEAGADQVSYWPDEDMTIGAEVANLGRKSQRVQLEFTWEATNGTDQSGMCTRAPDVLSLAPGERKRVAHEWQPRDRVSCTVTTTASRLETGAPVPVDAVVQPVRMLTAPAADGEFMQVRDGDFWLGDQKWYPHGCNFWPLYVSGSDPTVYNRHWLTPQNYLPDEVEADLTLAEALNMTSLSVILNGIDQLPCFNDFAQRCRAHGIRLNVFLGGAHPAAFDEAMVRELIVGGRLAGNEAIWAYDIAWEPRWGREDDRARYDGDWAAWIEEQYGSIEAAEGVWGCEANRDDEGRIVGPTNHQITQPGEWRVMVAVYRRFIDDYLNKRYNHACGVLRNLDPNHLLSHRVGYGGTGSLGAVTPMAYDPISGAKHLDFTSPEGWGLRRDWMQFKSAGFITAYCRYAGNGKPVFWSEYGLSLHPSYKPEDYEHQAKIHEWLGHMVLLSEAHGDASWWWPGGYRVNENSDYGIIHPWRAPRAAATGLMDNARDICAPRDRLKNRRVITIDRDAYVQGLAGAWQEFGDRYSEMVSQEVGVDVTTQGMGRTSADVPLRAVGGGEYTGVGPVQFLNAEFNVIYAQVGDAACTAVGDEAILVPAGMQVKLRASVGNTGDAEWPASSRRGGQVILVAETPKGDAEAAISTYCPRYGDVSTKELVLPVFERGTHTIVLHLAIKGRLKTFGERATITLKQY